MRKTLFTLLTLFISASIVSAQQVHKCGTDEQTELIRKANAPQFDAAKAAFENAWREHVKQGGSQLNKTNPKIIIPVVFHIFYDQDADNISDAAVNAMVQSMNDYYSANPSLISGVRNVFKDRIANCNFEFRLARKDPNGNCTNGIVRIQTTLTNRADNDIKALSTWDTKSYFNIWCANTVYSNGRAVGGYAQIPFGAGSFSTTDGILVVTSQARSDNTLAHEAGHSFGLYHPFQDSESDSCGLTNDEVEDTPPTYFLYSTSGVNTGRGDKCNDTMYNTCSTDNPDEPDMQENVMDYFGGSCSGVMFTTMQYNRMLFCLQNYRTTLISEANLVKTGVLDPPTTCAPIPAWGLKSGNFYTYTRNFCTGSAVNFVDQSYNGTATSWSWNFGEGANPQTSTVKNPTGITYTTEGSKTITLTVTNASGTATQTFVNAILVQNPSVLNYIAYNPDIPTTADGWILTSEEPTVKWLQTYQVATNGYSSMYLPGSNIGMYAKYFSIVTPAFDLSNATSPYFKFNYAFARNWQTNTLESTDQLYIQASTNCGLTWTNVRAALTGTTLSSIATTVPANIDFYPVNADQWKESNTTGQTIPKQPNVRFRLLFESRYGNNLFIDNIQIGQRTGLKELTAEEISLSIAPNPFNNQTKISYYLSKNAEVEVVVYDVVGKRVAKLFSGVQALGEQQVVLDRNTHNLKNGLYFVKFTINGANLTQKVIIN